MTADRLKILIVGGYGTFGGRLAQLLKDDERLQLLIGGRSQSRAQAFCACLQPKAAAVALAFDRDREIAPQLARIDPDLVVDATGPFQFYGADPYRLVRAALTLGIDYLDLADGSDFVKGIARFDAEARARGIFILSGVSSFPVLTAAVVRRLAHGMARIDTITGGIAPSPHANVGLNVIRAIASYAGRPVKLWRDGHRVLGYGLAESRRYTIAPPGRLPLWPVRFSLVDVPDLQVLPDLWPGVGSVWMGAGPVPEIWHRLLNACAWAVRCKILPSLSPFAGLMSQAVRRLSFGEHRGGMFVAVTGTGPAGERLDRSWHLLAEGDDGPLIPSMAAAVIIRHSVAGKRPASGARPATTDIELVDYEALFEHRRIFTGCRQSDARTDAAPLYRRILGEAWNALPAPLRAMHGVDGSLTAEGVASVERGRGLVARLVARLAGFPPAASEVPVQVVFRAEDGHEHWQRTFGKSAFASVQESGSGRFDRLICERFGPLRFGLALVVEDDQLRLVLRGWSFIGIPLPSAWAPRIDAHECAENGRFCFNVRLDHPLTGLIVQYRGWLVPRI